MRLMNKVLKKFLVKFSIVYLDDIFIFSKSLDEHLLDICRILERLREEKLLINLKKSSFFKRDSVYLGFVVLVEGVKMDPEKVKVILEWPALRSATEVRSFHGMASFYGNFIRNFSSICATLTEIMTGDRKEFNWTTGVVWSFKLMKKKVTEKPMLALSNFDKIFKVDFNASGSDIGSLLSQEGKPTHYFSENLNDTNKK